MQNNSRDLEAEQFNAELNGRAKPGLHEGRLLEPGEVPWHALPTGRLGLAIIGFTPSWFSVTMGTGILSTLLHQAPHQFTGVSEIGAALYLLNCLLFASFLAITCARFTMYPFLFRHLVNYPPQCFFIGAFPCGLSTIVSATAYIAVPKYGEWASTLALVLWWNNVAIALASCIGVPFLMFHVHHLSLDKMTGAWLLPVAPVIVSAAAGSVVAAVVRPHHAQIVIAVCYTLWGMGMGLSLLITTIYFHRLTVHHLPDSEVIVSAFLPMGPIGQGAFALIQLAQAGRKVVPVTGFLSSQTAKSSLRRQQLLL
ncbi:Plasma membrane sulfite pump involved in sulfite metabolism [Varicellaria rhodocarpa]|nr:Plasma membrane sulfite pump involved in sulfite metabolism [Varicellaria rhodocarpa]